MLEFFSNYPIKEYFMQLFHPKKTLNKVGMFFSRETEMLMVKKAKEAADWIPNLRILEGSPSLEDTKKEPDKQIAGSSYKKTVLKGMDLNKQNPVTLIIDDPEGQSTTYKIDGQENAEEILQILEKDPSSIVSGWKSYGKDTEYTWEITNMKLEILRGNMPLPEKIFIFGFPEYRSANASKWFKSQEQELTNIIPLTPALLLWAKEHGPKSQFVFLLQTSHEICTIIFFNQEVKYYKSLKTAEGFDSDEISDLRDITEGADLSSKELLVWTWGIHPSSPAHSKLLSIYPNLLALIPESLNEIQPLTIRNQVPEEKEAWILCEFTR
jgi:hypothetical protein